MGDAAGRAVVDPRGGRRRGHRASGTLQGSPRRTCGGCWRSFATRGGAAIEVLSSSHTPAQNAEYTTLARVFGLKGSCGSDYHGPGESWMEFGDLPPLPAGTTPVWSHW